MSNKDELTVTISGQKSFLDEGGADFGFSTYHVNDKGGQLRTFDKGKRPIRSKVRGTWRRLLVNDKGRDQIARVPDFNPTKMSHVSDAINSGIMTFSILPEDAWQRAEAGIIQEQRVLKGGVQDLVSAGLVQNEDIAAQELKFFKRSEMAPATITMEGRDNDWGDTLQLAEGRISVPVISVSTTAGFRTLRAYNSQQGFDWVDAFVTEGTAVIEEAKENALFNGYDKQLNTAAITFGYVNHPSTNTAASAGDWATPDNAISTVRTMQAALDTDNYDAESWILYVSTVQYQELFGIPRSTTSDLTQGMWLLENNKNISAIKQTKAQFLAAGSALGVVLKPNVVKWISEMPTSLVEWQSGDTRTTHWRLMSIAAPRVTDTFADRIGVVLSTGN